MTVGQLDMLEMLESDYCQEVKATIGERLKHYGIDDYYKRHIQGNCMLLSDIYSKLSALPMYKEYLQELVRELKQIAPIKPYEGSFSIGYSCVITDSERPRYYCHIGEGSAVGSNSPLFCLEEIPDEFFRL